METVRIDQEGVVFARNLQRDRVEDPLVPAEIGENPVAGGELLAKGVSLLAVTAFIMSWSTVGVVMLPLEASFLCRKFAVIRNAVNFCFAVLVAISTDLLLKVLG